MSTLLVTKTNLANTPLLLQQEVIAARETLKREMDLQSQLLKLRFELFLASMTIRFGAMLLVGMGLLFAALKLT